MELRRSSNYLCNLERNKVRNKLMLIAGNISFLAAPDLLLPISLLPRPLCLFVPCYIARMYMDMFNILQDPLRTFGCS